MRPTAKLYFDEHLWDRQDRCKVWPFSKDKAGYGRLRQGYSYERVHVLACIAYHGPRPPGMYATHGECHNPACWNGDHLSWQTPAKNQEDRLRDGTSNRGERHGQVRLTDEQVAEIRRRRTAGERVVVLAVEYGVHRRTIYDYIEGRRR